ncbi:MAG: ATP-dependent DNA helicase RecG [Butyrivibrio sp.]|nr:ATP-dependent DNA helicase RecG [Butyrivibrio sp.]
MNEQALYESVVNLKGVGDKTAALFTKCNIKNVGDLIHYYPRAYDEYSDIVRVCDARIGEIVTVRCVITGSITNRHVRNLSILNFSASDITGQIKFTYFNMPYLRSSLRAGKYYIFRGMLQQKASTLVMEQAQIFKDDEYAAISGSMQPRYPLVKGLTNNMVIKVMKQALMLSAGLLDSLPEDIIKSEGFVSHSEAVRNIHFPASKDKLLKAHDRLAFEEFFFFILKVRQLKNQADESINTHKMIETADIPRLLDSLPYKLTLTQLKIWDEIKNDMAGSHVMNRLIQGDVGSGKTILAFLSLLMTAANGYQGAIMAPTEVLACQHYDGFMEMKEKYNLPINPVLLIGSLTAKQKKLAQEKIAMGEYNLIVGTNALMQEKVSYKNLALVVTDEQHRFGVRQRSLLAGKGQDCHILAMSATPIPRTLAIILYGDLHISILNEMPGGRLPIKNCVVGTNYRPTAYKFIAEQISKGHQAYVICPMIEEGEMEGLENVTDYTKTLQNALGSSVRVEMLHGKMKGNVKDELMDEFSKGNIDVLVSTTVIEVGINVPNATVMMIENAERFGLAQLHQLRGRVGRGSSQSYCIFINTSDTENARQRLDIMNHSNDGFKIAEEDLKQRGPGDFFGIRQSGDLSFEVADIYSDSDMLKKASMYADDILREDPDLTSEKYKVLRPAVFPDGVNSFDFTTL